MPAALHIPCLPPCPPPMLCVPTPLPVPFLQAPPPAVPRRVPPAEESRARVERAQAALRRLENAPEVARWQDEPPQMPSGAVGKNGYLRLEFEQRAGRTVLAFADRRVPFLVQRALYWDEALPDMPCVCVITTSGCLLQGDRMTLSLAVGKNAQAHVTTQSATKIHMMNANYAAQIQDIRVEAGGWLEFVPDPLILHRTARFLSRTRIEVEEGASLLYGETLLPGRKYHHQDELFGFSLYSAAVEVVRAETGKTLFEEKALLEPARADPLRAGVLHGFEVCGTLLLIAPRAVADTVHAATGADISRAARLAWGCTRLPNDCGLLFRVLGMTSEAVRGKLREFWAASRRAVTGRGLPEAFLWR